MPKRLKVLIVDEQPMFRFGVGQSLLQAGGYEVVGEAGDAETAIRLAVQLKPEVVLLDIKIPGCGLHAASEISQSCANTAIVVLTVSDSAETVSAALKAGARGYILKGSTGAELARVLQSVSGGEAYVAPALGARLLNQLRQKSESQAKDVFSDLSTREHQILLHVAEGLTNKEIARCLTLSEKTVKHYMTNVLQKLNVRNRVEAVIQLRGRLQPLQAVSPRI